jgi:D-glycero-D-manno-heptose 1,7-bisphosphate phosphatase
MPQPGTVTSEGIWFSRSVIAASESRPGLFLDRDGVVVEEMNYLHRREDVRLEKGAVALVKWANRREIPVAVVTNQSGIARGLFGWTEFEIVQNELTRLLADAGARFDMVVACPFHPDFTPGWNQMHEQWRKPGPGMLHFAAKSLAIDLARSWMVGDNVSDIAAAKAAGLIGGVHILTGHGAKHRAAALRKAGEDFEVLTASDLEATLTLLEPQYGSK